MYFKMIAAAQRGCVLALTGKASAAVQMISAGIAGVSGNRGNIWSSFVLIIFGFGLCGPR